MFSLSVIDFEVCNRFLFEQMKNIKTGPNVEVCERKATASKKVIDITHLNVLHARLFIYLTREHG